jgi:chromosome segregation ATPase
MAIPLVIQGLVETEGGKVFELETPKGLAWLESIGSFRFEPSDNSKPYTVRKEAGIYWYGCRKIAGKVRKKYIGKSLEVTVAKLEEIAEALEIPSVARANKVAEVTHGVAQDRLTALELQVGNLQKAVEALQEALLGKLESGDSSELPKADNVVAERLQNDLSNLDAENEKLRADYVALLESSTAATDKLREEVREVRSQLEQERADREETEAELAELKQKSTAAREFPDAADLLNQLKAKRKKSKTDLADLEVILEILES